MSKRLPSSPKYKATQGYFRHILFNERRIACYEAEIPRQQSRLVLNGVEGGESVSKTMEGGALEKGFVMLYDFCERMDTDLVGYVAERNDALRVIDNLSDPDMYEVVYRRYFEGLRFGAIHRLLTIGNSPMSERRMYSLHEQAMCKLWPHIPVEYRQRKSVQ